MERELQLRQRNRKNDPALTLDREGDDKREGDAAAGEEVEVRRRPLEVCVFVSSLIIILVFIALVLFVLSFRDEITTVIEKGISYKPKLKDLYCQSTLCKSFGKPKFYRLF